MITYQQTVAGAADFDGLALATGQLNFETTYGFALVSSDVVPTIYGIAVTLALAAAGRIQVELYRDGADATVKEVLRDTGLGSTATSWSYSPERKRAVYRDGAVIWRLRVITTKGGAGNATVAVMWRPERWV